MSDLTECTTTELDSYVWGYPRPLTPLLNTIADPPAIGWFDESLNVNVAVQWQGDERGPACSKILRWPAGYRVRMSDAGRATLRANGLAEHVDEFGECVGVVEGPTDSGHIGVRWLPQGLTYEQAARRLTLGFAYEPEHLVMAQRFNVKQYVPNFVSGVTPARGEARTLEELRALPFIARWELGELQPKFSSWAIERIGSAGAYLMALVDGGRKWFVVALLNEPDLYGLPEWKAP